MRCHKCAEQMGTARRERGTQIMPGLGNTSALSTTDTPTADAGMTKDASKGASDAGGQGIRLIRRLVVINLGLVALQSLSAGFFLSGYERAVTVHAVVAVALQFGALIQAVTAVVLWRRRRVPAWMAGLSIGLFVIVFLEVGLGYNKSYWLHVPIGVAIGWMQRQAIRLDTLWRTTGAPS
jgi:Na+/proline symporter